MVISGNYFWTWVAASSPQNPSETFPSETSEPDDSSPCQDCTSTPGEQKP